MPHVESPDEDRVGPIGSFLASARRAAGLRQVDVVGRTTLSQAQLSRIERGSAMPTVEQGRALTTLYRLGETDRARVLQAANDHETGRADSRLVVQRGNILSLQQRFRRIEEQASSVSAFSPSMVPGQLQTPAYVSAVFGEPARAPVVQDRLRRAVDHGDNLHRAYQLILGEGALRWPMGSRAVMIEQIEYVIKATELPHVRLGLIGSWSVGLDVAPGPAFYLYDNHTVVLSQIGGFALLNSLPEVATYRTTFEHLTRLATFGALARSHLRGIADEYRSAGSIRP